MTSLENIVINLLSEIEKLVDQKVDEKLEHKVPEMLRAVGLRDADLMEPNEQLIDALEVARRLGFDLSSEDSIRLSKQRVYNLARQKLIPSVRLSPRRIRFNPMDIQKLIKDGGLAAAFTQAA